LDPARISFQTLKSLESLRPFGVWFPAPIFLLEDIYAPILSLGQTGEHIRWEYGRTLEIVWFRMAEYRDQLSRWPVSLIGTLKMHIWRDTVTPQFHVIDALVRG
jgi:single-stranded DNA-specific DHH superfamily exonuclease